MFQVQYRVKKDPTIDYTKQDSPELPKWTVVGLFNGRDEAQEFVTGQEIFIRSVCTKSYFPFEYRVLKFSWSDS